ncbi:hypothetical protein [Derxia gummosa]|uniref:Uncharacterized protein n=1 Tax=Derxia gummosa DSM 723 TaxID=1121388 RepID=A0A8B6XC66_9BURK|nr:hypothetical protein [Derxia gummosa]
MPQPPASSRLPLICGAIPVGLRAPGGAAPRRLLSGPTVPLPGGAGRLPVVAQPAASPLFVSAAADVSHPRDDAAATFALDAESDPATDACQRRRALLLAVLARPSYARIVLAAGGPGGGCGLAVELAGRCDQLSLVTPTDTARSACTTAVLAAGFGDRLASPRLANAPDDWPDTCADLVVLDDYACWFDSAGFSRLITRVLAGLVPGGELVCCDPRLPPAEAPLTGDYVHARLRHELALDGLLSHVERDFRIDSWTRLAESG